MSVAVGYLGTEGARQALAVAAREAATRDTSLQVIHVVEVRDESVVSDHRDSVSAEVSAALEEAGLGDLDWDLHLSTEDEDIADAIVDAALALGADLLVIGSRRRSSIGKLLFGSVSQTASNRDDLEVRVVDAAADE